MRSSIPSPRAALLLLLVVGTSTLAAQYETEIAVENETDLYELNQRSDISDSTLETLVELMRTGVDLNNASREELYELPNITYSEVDQLIEYRLRVTHIDDPADLVRAGVLTQKQLLQIAPFLIITEQAGISSPVSGVVRLVSMYTLGDTYAPPYYLQSRAKGPYGFSAGVLAVGTRRRLGELRWDDTLIDDNGTASTNNDTVGGFTATAPRYGVELPKFFLQWKGPQRSVIVGTFRVGFGQRLTLDNTTRNTPDGIYPDDAVLSSLRALSGFCRISDSGDLGCTQLEGDRYVTPDFRWRDPFRGVTGTVQDLTIGSATLGLTAFASYQTRSVYQYALYFRDRCDDPHTPSDGSGSNPYCGSPPVHVRNDDGSVSSAKYNFQTLPAIFNEATAGGNATLKLGPGRRIGLTGYFSNPIQNFPEVDFQEYNRYPYGGAFGAVGIDGAYSIERFSFFAEGTRSFDNTPGNGGGFGVIQRSVFSIPKQEVELVLRYYDRKFANPYARAVSEPDQLDGQRVRNELGARIRYLGQPLPDFSSRVEVDVWTLPGDAKAANTAGTTNLRAAIRTDFTGWSFFRPGLWFDYRNKGLGGDVSGSDFGAPGANVVCYEVSTSSDSEGDSLPCDGEYFRVIQRAQFVPIRKYLTLTVQAQEKWVSEARYPSGFRTDVAFFVQASSQPTENIRLRVRSKYLDEGFFDVEPKPPGSRISADLIGERSLWSLADVAYVWPKRAEIRVRYDNYVWLDQRASSLARQPNPEHRLRLELEGRF